MAVTLGSLGCGADSADRHPPGGPTACADIATACQHVDLPQNLNPNDPLFQCQFYSSGDDEARCATLDEQLDCINRCQRAS